MSHRIMRRDPAVIARSPAVLVPLIRKEHAAGTEHYRETGKLLLEAKAHPTMKHGDFKPWIARSFVFSYDSAKVYMRSATAKGEHAPSLRKVRRDPATRRQTHRRPREVEVSLPESRAIRDMALRIVQAGFKALAPACHPDHAGGSIEQMQVLNEARGFLQARLNEWPITRTEH
jgi:hypothetical protein